MPAEAFLALDLGTSHLGCLIIDAQGRTLAQASQPWTYPTEPEAGSLARSLEPDATIRALGALCRRALSQAALPPSAIAAVACTAQREGCVFLDSAGGARYAGPNLDLRAALEGMACDNEHALELYRSTGHLPSLLFAPARLRWLETHRPADRTAVRTILGLPDWLTFRLTGERRSDYTSACELGLLDLASLSWSEAVLRRWDIERALLPPLGWAGELVGAVTPAAAAITGLAPGTPVAAGCADTPAALLGLGALEPGQTGIVTGWSIPVQRICDRPVIDDACRTWSGIHLLPRRWVLESNASEAGNAYRWAVDTLAQGDYQKAEYLASAAPPGADGAQSHLGAAVFNARQTGLHLGGLLFPVPFTAGEASAGTLLRATLEGICYAVRANLEQLDAIAGPFADLRMGGGLARSPLFGRILASCLARPVSLGSADASLLGAAALATVAAHAHRDLAAASAALLPAERMEAPDPSWASVYQDGYERWLRGAQGLRRLGEETL